MSQGDDSAFEPLADVLRRHIIETMPFGPGDVVLGQDVTKRRLHSARTVAPELGLSIVTAHKRLHPHRRRAGRGQRGACRGPGAPSMHSFTPIASAVLLALSSAPTPVGTSG